MTIQHIIDTLPDQAKRSVLYSLVGSINASLIGTAASVVTRLERDDYNIKELSVQDAEQLLSEADSRADLLTNARRLARVGTTLRDQLIEVTNDDKQGSISGSLDYMTKAGNTRALDGDLLMRTLIAAGITDVDPKHIEAMHKVNQVQRAERLASQRGAIEWVIDQVFVPPTLSEVHYEKEEREDGTMFSRPITTDYDVDVQLEDLPEEMRERLLEKLSAALNRARDATVLGVMNRDTRYSFGDLSLIAGAITEANDVDVAVSVPVTKSKKEKLAA